jgi:hypothetical protein
MRLEMGGRSMGHEAAYLIKKVMASSFTKNTSSDEIA